LHDYAVVRSVKMRLNANVLAWLPMIFSEKLGEPHADTLTARLALFVSVHVILETVWKTIKASSLRAGAETAAKEECLAEM
jgi:hypothetical protein